MTMDFHELDMRLCGAKDVSQLRVSHSSELFLPLEFALHHFGPILSSGAFSLCFLDTVMALLLLLWAVGLGVRGGYVWKTVPAAGGLVWTRSGKWRVTASLLAAVCSALPLIQVFLPRGQLIVSSSGAAAGLGGPPMHIVLVALLETPAWLLVLLKLLVDQSRGRLSSWPTRLWLVVALIINAAKLQTFGQRHSLAQSTLAQAEAAGETDAAVAAAASVTASLVGLLAHLPYVACSVVAGVLALFGNHTVIASGYTELSSDGGGGGTGDHSSLAGDEAAASDDEAAGVDLIAKERAEDEMYLVQDKRRETDLQAVLMSSPCSYPERDSVGNPYDSASWWSRLTFSYLLPLLRLGYKRPLVATDIPPIPIADRPTTQLRRVLAQWQRQLALYDDRASLFWAIARVHGGQFAFAGLLKLLHDVVQFCEPMLLHELIGYVARQGSLWEGAGLALALFTVSSVKLLLQHQYFFIVFRVGYMVQSSVRSLMYRKALNLSASARQSVNSGALVTKMSVDAERLGNLTYAHMVWSGFFQIIGTLYLLHGQIGFSMLAGLGMLLLMLPLNGWLAQQRAKAGASTLKYTTQRMKATSELIDGIEILKLFAAERLFGARVQGLRSDEVRHYRRAYFLGTFSSLTWASASVIVAIVSFGVFAAVGGQMTSQVVFTSFSLFSLLRFPLLALPMVFTSNVDLYVSLKRIRAFLVLPELGHDNLRYEYTESGGGGDSDGGRSKKPVLEFNDASFSWSEDSTLASPGCLRNISFTVSESELVCIIGLVGAGKSSLLSASLGHIMKMKGEVILRGSVALSQQQPWIKNATIRDNVVGGRPFNQKLYDLAIQSSQLKRDLAILPAGDETELGERGINLSGGQKARVSMARAVYVDADLYLLDDPLSALDAHVGRALIQDCLAGPNASLRQKARLLNTHQLHVLPLADMCIVMSDGNITEKGTYVDLMADKKSDFCRVVTAYTKESEKEKAGSDDEDEDDSTSLDNDDDNLATNGSTVTPDKTSFDDSSAVLSRQIDDKAKLATSSAADASSATQPSEKGGKTGAANSPRAGSKLVEAEKMSTGSIRWEVYWAYFSLLGPKWKVFLTLFMYPLSVAIDAGGNFWLSHWATAVDNHLLDSSAAGAGLASTNSTMASAGSTVSGTAASQVSSMTATVPTDSWLKDTLGFYFGIYVCFGLAQTIFAFIFQYSYMLRILWQMGRVHTRLLKSLVNAPMSFFHTVPSGRLLNRFSKDLNALDMVLPSSLSMFLGTLLRCVAILVTVAIVTPMFVVFLLPLSYTYLLVRRLYLATAREVQRLEAVSKSPLFSHVSETLNGFDVIRASGDCRRFELTNMRLQERAMAPQFLVFTLNRWLGMSIEILGNLIVFLASLFVVMERGAISPALAGLSIGYALSLTSSLNWMVRQSGKVETDSVSCERIIEYFELPREAPVRGAGGRGPPADETAAGLHDGSKEPLAAACPPDDQWPAKGKIEFRHLFMRYRPGLPWVLKDLNIVIKPGHKIGVVGRTGAGKSSILVALFRLAEPVRGSDSGGEPLNDGEVDLPDSGPLFIDDVDVSRIGLHELRGAVGVIPQTPKLFNWSVRRNLDPMERSTDADIWKALEDVSMKSAVQEMGGLDFEVLENGENLSVGQRQLLCLARAMLTQSRILLLDEATAAVDYETDSVIQKVIRKTFQKCTVITVAHRIATIMDSDRVLVMSDGRVAEYDRPDKLLADPESYFAKLVAEHSHQHQKH